MGSVNCDGLVDFSINQYGHEDDTESDNLASLKPLCISSLSLTEGPIDLINYGGDCVNNPISCKESSNFALGVLGFVTPLRDTPVNKGYYLRYCSKGNTDFSFKHEFGHGPYGIFPSCPVYDGFPSLAISEGLVVTGALRAVYSPSGVPL